MLFGVHERTNQSGDQNRRDSWAEKADIAVEDCRKRTQILKNNLKSDLIKASLLGPILRKMSLQTTGRE